MRIPTMFPAFLTVLIAAAAVPLQGAAASTFHVLHAFGGDAKFSVGITRDPAGNLFGGALGGRFGQGFVYELSPKVGGGWDYTVLYDFPANRAFGVYPEQMIVDTAGNLYGATIGGGTAEAGVVFKLTPNADRSAWTETVLHNFTYNSVPRGRLVYAGSAQGQLYDGVSPFYGVAENGGTHGRGNAYSMAFVGGNWVYGDLYDFCAVGGKRCIDGADLLRGMVMDASGNLYGGAVSGGHKNKGVAFKLSPNGATWSETVLYTFCSIHRCVDGYSPGGPFAMDGLGNLYGTAAGGGRADCKRHFEKGCEGVVFKLDLTGASPVQSVLYRFCQKLFCTDGARPNGLVLDPSGTIYGITGFGGQHDSDRPLGAGTIYAVTDTLQRLYAFCTQSDCSDGYLPNSDIVTDGAGNFFGTTQEGGDFANGVVFELSP